MTGKEKTIVRFAVGGVLFWSIILVGREAWSEYKRVVEKSKKFRVYFQILDKWLICKEKQILLENYFVGNHFKTIAIYGMGALGRHLEEELKDSNTVKIVYGIDKSAESINNSINSPIKIRSDKEELPDVDVVIVTVVLEFDEIRKMLGQKMSCPIVSLEEVFEDI